MKIMIALMFDHEKNPTFHGQNMDESPWMEGKKQRFRPLRMLARKLAQLQMFANTGNDQAGILQGSDEWNGNIIRYQNLQGDAP